MQLAFGGARANGAPAHQVGDELRREDVEVLHAGRHAAFVEFEQQLARGAQALVDLEAVVEVGIVDQAFPAHGGARLFEVHAHHDQQIIGQALPGFGQQGGVFQGGLRVVDRARPHDHQQAVITACQDVLDGGPRRNRGGRGGC